MSGERDYMNHNSMTQMAKSFQQAEKQLEETVSTMKNLAKQMEDGALQGDGGQAFVAAINGPLTKKLNVLKQKMKELEGDVKKAQQANREAEGTAKGRFQN